MGSRQVRQTQWAVSLSPLRRLKISFDRASRLQMLRLLTALKASLGVDQEAVDAGALELGARSLALLSAGERADAHAIERSHIANHGLVDLGLARSQRLRMFALDARRKGLRLGLGPQHADLDAEAAFGLGRRRALPRRNRADWHIGLACPSARFGAGRRGGSGCGMRLRRGLDRCRGRRRLRLAWARRGGRGAAKPAGEGI